MEGVRKMTTETVSLISNKMTRLGMAGFIFFTVKGLIWLSVPVVLAWYVQ
jgi:hypothetical protein